MNIFNEYGSQLFNTKDSRKFFRNEEGNVNSIKSNIGGGNSFGANNGHPPLRGSSETVNKDFINLLEKIYNEREIEHFASFEKCDFSTK